MTTTTAIQAANELLSRHGITVSMTRDTDSSAKVSREPLPAEDARKLVAALTALGIEASSAPDHDDRGREWLYVTLADQTATEDDDTDPAGLYDYDTAEYLRDATDAEIAASRDAGPEGVILLADDGTVLRADDAGADEARRVYVAQ
jgi:hypothetical protein